MDFNQPTTLKMCVMTILLIITMFVNLIMK